MELRSHHGTSAIQGAVLGEHIQSQYFAPLKAHLTPLLVRIDVFKPHRIPTVRLHTRLFAVPTANNSSATMNEGPQGDCFLSAHLLPEPDEGGNYRWPTCTTPYVSLFPGTPLTPGTPVAHPIRIRPHYPMSFWCSAAQPTGSNAYFAIGTSEGLHTLEGTSSNWSLSKKPYKGNIVPSRTRGSPEYSQSQRSVFAVEWMSQDVIAAGQKNSKIFLHDLRSGGSATRLQHNDAVMDLKRMDEYRLVAAGPSSVCNAVYAFVLFSSLLIDIPTSYECTTSASRQTYVNAMISQSPT